MKSLVLFDDVKCREYSPDTPLMDLPSANKSIFVDGPTRHFSTVGLDPVRVGNLPQSHITLDDTTATFAIYPQTLDVLDDSDVYLNGKKIEAGQHAIAVGDSIWAGTTNIVVHSNYISCIGGNYTTTLNISTHTPEMYDEFPIYKRSPRIIKREPTEQI